MAASNRASPARATVLLLPIVWALVLTTTAQAGVILVGEDRLVRASLDGTYVCTPATHEFCICDPGSIHYPTCSTLPPPGDYTQLDEAAGAAFADFDEAVQVDSATANQTSMLAADVIEGSGAIDAHPFLDYAEYIFGETVVSVERLASATATSRAHVTFAIDEPMRYSLEGSWNGGYVYAYQIGLTKQMRLTDGVATLAEIPCDDAPYYPQARCAATDQIVRGTLAPGTYHLEVEAGARGTPGGFGGPPGDFGHFDYAFRLALRPLATLPALGWLGRSASAALLVSIVGLRLGLFRARLADPDRTITQTTPQGGEGPDYQQM